LNIKLAVTLEKLLLSADHLDLKSLCLIPKRTCWTLNVDAMVLDSGGNLFDAISIATRAALANTTYVLFQCTSSMSWFLFFTTKVLSVALEQKGS